MILSKYDVFYLKFWLIGPMIKEWEKPSNRDPDFHRTQSPGERKLRNQRRGLRNTRRRRGGSRKQ